jgi:hypothetical protein
MMDAEENGADFAICEVVTATWQRRRKWQSALEQALKRWHGISADPTRFSSASFAYWDRLLGQFQHICGV